MKTEKSDVLLLLDGDAPSPALLRSLGEGIADRCIVATDGAARSAKALGLRLDAIVGDMDSIDGLTRDHFSQTSFVSIPDQSTNDFEKALCFLIENHFSQSLTILGMNGKRTDHLLTNWSVLVRFRDYFEQLHVLDELQQHLLLTSKHNCISVRQPNHSLVSLTPMPFAQSVSTVGLRYPLFGTDMRFGENEGLSNVITSEAGACITIQAGALMVSFPLDCQL